MRISIQLNVSAVFLGSADAGLALSIHPQARWMNVIANACQMFLLSTKKPRDSFFVDVSYSEGFNSSSWTLLWITHIRL